MPLPVGARISAFEVLAKLGEGGMGEVYRAHDTKLGRDVALKILPAAFLQDPDRLARFRREAQVLASLNHPNIAAIYGLEESGPVTALVLELVEGPTLADRIAARTPEVESVGSRPRDSNAGPARGGRAPRGLEVDDALPIARQIVAALEEAHGRGVVHRDLKPANISVREDGTVKVLDFGLAKLADPSGSASNTSEHDIANSPTVTSPAMTAMGMILGTAAYMSPEQAKGRPVDKRADIWAFGCVLFEMLTGRRAFEGDDVTETMAGILRGEPDWTAVPSAAPVALKRLLRRCLVKDPARRLPDIGAARLEIEDALSSPPEESRPALVPSAPARTARRWPERLALGAVTLALVVVSVLYFTARPAPRGTYRFQVAPAPGTTFAGGNVGAAPVVSPDGRLLVFRAVRASQGTLLWLRNLETMDVRELPGTEGGNAPFWSPDSRSIAFFADQKLKRLEIAGGTPRTLTDLAAPGVGGGAWSPDGTTIVFGGGPNPALMRIPAAGGPTTPVTTIDAARKEAAHLAPAFLPDSRRFLFRVIPAGIELASLDRPERTRLLDLAANAIYAAPGYLLYVRENRLVAQPFDASAGTLSGEPVILAEQVSPDGPTFSVSPAGVLAYQSGDSQSGGVPVWVNRAGRELGEIGAASDVVQYPRLSPDGRRLAVVLAGDIWVHDLRGRPPIRATFGGRDSPALSPIWTRDGRRLVYELGGTTGTPGLWSSPADGSERTGRPVSPAGHYHPHGWSHDDGEILAVEFVPAGTDIVAIQATEPFAKRGVVQAPGYQGQRGAVLSPDGRWLAYTDDPTGSIEIWVRPFGEPGAAVRVSPTGGVEPVWSHNGRELFYREGGKLMSVSIQPGNELQFTPPVALFDGQFAYTRPGSQPPTYDASPDGRFVFLKPLAPVEGHPLTVVVNWVEELERRVRPE